jgi:hypothetical protein
MDRLGGAGRPATPNVIGAMLDRRSSWVFM